MKFQQPTYIYFSYHSYGIISEIEAMVTPSFPDLFVTTKKGIPDLTSLPASTSISLSFFICSAIIQFVIFLYFASYFIVAVNRVALKIKNNNFGQLPLEGDASNKAKKDDVKQGGEKQQREEKKEQLIYEFDELGEEAEEPKGSEQKDYFQSHHDQNEESFIKLDNKLLHFQPFLASFIICNNIFAIDIITTSLLVLTIACFVLFNLKQTFKSKKILSCLSMLLPIFAFTSFFINKPL